MKQFSYPALFSKQGKDKSVFVFCATAKDILSFATIDRISRSDTGKLSGFQRPQVSKHIKEIRNYLNQSDAVLPNSVVVAFMDGITVTPPDQSGQGTIQIDGGSSPGLVVDGQQRLTALSQIDNPDFEVFVTGLICEGHAELRKQFILINNTKPLPKPLIYELLPDVDGLPSRLSSRSAAARIVEQLNYDETSSLKGQIKQHTNPDGVLQDTVLQKVIMGSLSDGILREHREDDDPMASFNLLSTFYAAVQTNFEHAWLGQTPKTSRLVHGAGLVAMGYVMEHLCTAENAKTAIEFESGLAKLNDIVAWTNGTWEFGPDNRRQWNSLQNIPRDYMELTHFLFRELRKKHQTSPAIN